MGCSQPRTQHGDAHQFGHSWATRQTWRTYSAPGAERSWWPAVCGTVGAAGGGPSTTLRAAACPGWVGGGRVSFPRTPLGGGSPLASRVTVVHVVLGAQPLSVTQCRGDGHLCVMSVSSASSWGVCWGGGGPTNTAVLTFCEADELGSQIPLALRCGGFLP